MIGDTVTAEFFGGSQDGLLVMTDDAPDYLEVKAGAGWVEIYERQNDEPPFVYVQIGFTKKEQWA